MTAPASASLLSNGTFIACLYMATSIALIFFNKAAFAYYDFSAPNLLTLAQSLASLLLLTVFRHYRLIQYQSFSTSNLYKLSSLGLSFLAYMMLGMFAMKNVSVPMYTTLRRTTIIFVMTIEYCWCRKVSNRYVLLSVLVMLMGAMIAGYRDLNFDLTSYLLVAVYNLFTALYLILIHEISAREKKLTSESKDYVALNQYDFMYYNNLISIPLLVVILLCTNEVPELLVNPYLRNAGFHVCLLMSSLLAFLLNYAIFANTAINSALTQTVSGQAKDVLVVLIGYLAFNDSKMEAGNLIGIVVGFVGSIMYGAVKLRQANAANSTITGASHGYSHSHNNYSRVDDDDSELVDDHDHNHNHNHSHSSVAAHTGHKMSVSTRKHPATFATSSGGGGSVRPAAA